MTRPVITLLTDFGTSDPFVGVMKGVIAGICPEANTIDLTHEVPPQDVMTGAFLLERSFRFFPPGAIHVAVVDPGVGTRRRGLALSSGGHFFVGPDNGLLSLAARKGRGVRLTEGRYFLQAVSRTFHGRDIFAPVAAYLARGTPLASFGPRIATWRKIAVRAPRATRSGVLGEVVSIDRFGNLITNLEPRHFHALRRARLCAGAFETSSIAETYGAARPGEICVVVNGYGLLEIAVRNGSARDALGLGAGDRVRLLAEPARSERRKLQGAT